MLTSQDIYREGAHNGVYMGLFLAVVSVLSFLSDRNSLLGIIAIIISLVSKAIIPMLVFAFTMRSAGPFAAFLLGLTWKNATAGAGIWSIVLGSIAGVYWEFVGNPYGIMSIIFGSVVSLIVFVVVVFIERAMGKPAAPPAIPEDLNVK